MTGEAAAVAAAADAWFTPRRGGPIVADRPEGAEALSLRLGDLTLRGFRVGTGPTVLLVHGWAGSIAQLQPLVAPLVEAGNEVIGFDLPGHGASDGAQTDFYRLSGALRSIAAAFAPVAHVVAHSMGAPVTLQAVEDGLDLDDVVFIAPGARLRDAFATFVERAQLPAAVASGLRAEIERRFGEEVWEVLQMERTVSSIDLPALLIHDPSDREAPIGPVRRVAERWPTARLVEIDGVGHNRILASPAVASEVVAFVGSNRRRDGSAADVVEDLARR